MNRLTHSLWSIFNAWVILHILSADFSQNQHFPNSLSRIPSERQTTLVQDQALNFVGPDLGHICLILFVCLI